MHLQLTGIVDHHYEHCEHCVLIMKKKRKKVIHFGKEKQNKCQIKVYLQRDRDRERDLDPDSDRERRLLRERDLKEKL